LIIRSIPVVSRRFPTRAESVLTLRAIPTRSMRSWAESMR
jgi:hypothetical protein